MSSSPRKPLVSKPASATETGISTWAGAVGTEALFATRLAPNLPVTVAVKFVPGNGYSKELAELSNTASLRSRIAHYANDLSDGKTADIIINDLPFPR